MPVWRRIVAQIFFQPWRPVVAGWCALLLCAGCQVILAPENFVSADKPVVEAEPAARESAEIPELTQLLNEGHWELDRSWSTLSVTTGDLVHDADPQRLPAHRWRFVVPLHLKPAPKPRDGLPAPVMPVDPERQALLAQYQWLWDSQGAVDEELCRKKWPQVSAALRELMKRTDAMGGSAAILLARHREEHADVSELLANVVSPHSDPGAPAAPVKQGLELRCAAAETWCALLSQRNADPEEALAPPGRILEHAILPDEIRAELFRSISRRITPQQIPGLNDVIRQGVHSQGHSPALLLAALDACVLHAWEQRKIQSEPRYDADRWPEGLRNCRFSSDPTQRKLYGRWAALAHQPDVLAVLKSQRLDTDLSVREVAVYSLGLLDSSAAREELHLAMTKGAELEKIAAIPGLARWGLEEIHRYVHEDSPRVRMAIAAESGHQPSRQSGLVLAEFLRDRNPEVQLAALAACDHEAWEGVERVPLLLHALRVGVLKTRLAALARLQQEWGVEPVFPADGSLEEREAAVRQLAAQHHVSSEVFTAFTSGGDVQSSAEAQDRQRIVVQQLLDEFLSTTSDPEAVQTAKEQLQSLAPASAVFLEQELARLPGPAAEVICRNVLPRMNPAFAALASLDSRDAATRRNSARQIKELAAQASLSAPVLQRIQTHLISEQDQLVWQNLFAAILPDSTPEAAQIALIALNSQWPDVRHLGCNYLERHPQPEFAMWLLPRLQDAERSVKLRAIPILALCGNPVALDGFADSPETLGLRQFLASSDQQLRWEAVLAMSALGDLQASQELIRQTYDPQPRQRERALRGIAKTGQSRFIEPLVKQLWTESDPVVQLALLDALHQLAPLEDQPGLAAETSISDKINLWTRWWETRQSRNRSGTVRPVSATTGRSQ